MENREIKFRAWDKFSNKMIHEIESLYQDEGYPACFHDFLNEDYNVMQYTGLKDKNGKEIYEGDLLKVIEKGKGKNRKWKGTNEAVFMDGGFVIVNRECCEKCRNNEGCICTLGEAMTFTATEIIGNIYENPELIKQANEA